jgi:ATP-dependent DNA helicase RecG
VRLCDEAGTEQAPGVVEQVVRLLQPHLSAEVLDGVARVRRWTYPLPALREVLVNALVHRDYLLTASGTDVCAYADRLEVSSPGRPPNGITPDRMRAGCRAARNQLLKDVMLDYGYMEHLGMGIPRKVVKLMREQEGTDPELQVEEEGFRMVLRLRSGVAGHGALSE